MSGDRGVTRSVTGATRVLGLMFSLLCLLSLANCLMNRDTLDQTKEKIRILKQKAEAVKVRFESTRNIPLEIMDKTEQYVNDVEVIIMKGDPEVKKMMPMFQVVRSMLFSVRETLVKADGDEDTMMQDIEINIVRMKNEMIEYLEKLQEKQ